MKSALVAPAGTTTLAGTVATAGLLLVRMIAAPPAGAAALRVTVPVEELGPMTLAGFRLQDEICSHAIGPVGFQLAPPSMLLNTLALGVPA